MSTKDKEKNRKMQIIENSKKSDLYKTVLDYFPDAELVNVKHIKKNDE